MSPDQRPLGKASDKISDWVLEPSPARVASRYFAIFAAFIFSLDRLLSRRSSGITVLVPLPASVVGFLIRDYKGQFPKLSS